MSTIMDILTLLLLSTWVATALGLSVLIVARVANLIVREFINQ